jgi:hypothetical protein
MWRNPQRRGSGDDNLSTSPCCASRAAARWPPASCRRDTARIERPREYAEHVGTSPRRRDRNRTPAPMESRAARPHNRQPSLLPDYRSRSWRGTTCTWIQTEWSLAHRCRRRCDNPGTAIHARYGFYANRRWAVRREARWLRIVRTKPSRLRANIWNWTIRRCAGKNLRGLAL